MENNNEKDSKPEENESEQKPEQDQNEIITHEVSTNQEQEITTQNTSNNNEIFD